jgi:hypothetical protein
MEISNLIEFYEFQSARCLNKNKNKKKNKEYFYSEIVCFVFKFMLFIMVKFVLLRLDHNIINIYFYSLT